MNYFNTIHTVEDKKYLRMVVEIFGYTDSEGTKAYNIKLSKERAQAVINYLIDKGINKDQMKAKGYGEPHPITDNKNSDGSDNPLNRKLNRRFELTIMEMK